MSKKLQINSSAKVTPAERTEARTKKTLKKSVLAENKGVQDRIQRDLSGPRTYRKGEEPSDQTVHQALVQKAALYDQLRKRKLNGADALSTKKEHLLVDFDAKYLAASSSSSSSSSSDSNDSSSESDDDDPMEEFIDEFGRTRTLPRSLIPLELRPAGASPPTQPAGDTTTPSGMGGLHTQCSDTPRLNSVDIHRIREGGGGDSDIDLPTYYDYRGENRNLGAAHFRLSMDETTRKQQLRELKRLRKEYDSTAY
ncbi:hypothetical protein BJ085DRAFT_33780 [Dimargaris cristalligena]|uniref:Uncharacterized protein n=1 Tax=Dimargaris cristalligena TaxID=215637 RepID=A0A4Q0A049_9FUNG|nr:hypothetical protein BJ085DRAFT_33780 [Dimargaris cristalligena]|eukprot:RKP39393.1 hypothetical protein BJ085DRAFT_33780 [Dimargaris cristalligena]